MSVLKKERATRSLLIVETPNFAWKGNALPDQKINEQRRKTEFIFHTFRQMGVHAVGIGEGESALGLEWLNATAEKHQAPLVASNLSCENLSFPKIRLESIEELQIGIVSLLSESSTIDGCKVESVDESIKAITENNTDVDIWVALTMLNVNDQNDLASKFPELDIIVDGYSKALLSKPIPLENDTVRISMGSKGKFFGILDVNTQDPTKGYQLQDGLAFHTAELERIDRRLEALKSNTEVSEGGQDRQQRRIAYYEKERLEAVEAINSFVSTPPTGNTVVLTKFELSKSIEDDVEIQSELNIVLSDIEALSLQSK